MNPITAIQLDPSTSKFYRPPSILRCLSLASEMMGVSESDILGPCRNAKMIRARFLAIWLARHSTNWSSVVIGRCMGRDHSTVLDALVRFEHFRIKSPDLQNLSDDLLASIQAMRAA